MSRLRRAIAALVACAIVLSASAVRGDVGSTDAVVVLAISAAGSPAPPPPAEASSAQEAAPLAPRKLLGEEDYQDEASGDGGDAGTEGEPYADESADASSTSSSSSSFETGLVIAIFAAGAVAILATAFMCWRCCRRRGWCRGCCRGGSGGGYAYGDGDLEAGMGRPPTGAIPSGGYQTARPPAPPPGRPAAPPAGGHAPWAVAIKKPGSKQGGTRQSRAWCLEAGSAHVQQIDDIMDWVRGVLGSQRWTGFLAYNDQPYGHSNREAHLPSDPQGCGHCKGVVIWNQASVGWLVHTVPRWPCPQAVNLAAGGRGFPAIEGSQLIHGQAFAWVVLPAGQRAALAHQLFRMQAYVMHSTEPRSSLPVAQTYAVQYGERDAPAYLELGRGVAHVAKHGAWGRCIYADYLARARALGSGRWLVQTWNKERDRAELASARVVDVVRMRFPDGSSFRSGSDHSKWAVSLEVEGLVFVGDLNRAASQLGRGGGGLVIRSATLWRFLRAVPQTDSVAEQ